LLGDFEVGDANVDTNAPEGADATGAPGDSSSDRSGNAGDTGGTGVVDAGCDGPCPVVLAAGQTGAVAIATDGSNVYWLNGGSVGRVLTCSVGGCPSGPTVLIAGQPFPSAIAVSNGFVYWTNNGTSANSFSDAAVMKCATGGCPNGPTVIYSGIDGSGTAIAADGVRVYWTGYRGVYMCPTSGCGASPSTLIPHDGGLVDQPAQGIALDVSNAYWTGTFVDGGGFGQGIMMCSKFSCSAPTVLTSGQHPGGVAVTGTALVWDEGLSSQSLVTCRIGACSPITIGTAPNAIGNHLAADSTGIYWGAAAGLNRCPISGCNGASSLLVGDAGSVGPVALDSTYVYYIAGGAVMKLAK
jgi:hypothetical protein